MREQKKLPWQFWTQMIPLLLLIAWVCYIITPTNDMAGGVWELIARYCLVIAVVAALPIGLCGVRWDNEANSWYKATKVFAVVNLWIVGLMIAAVVLFLILLLSGSFSA